MVEQGAVEGGGLEQFIYMKIMMNICQEPNV
jgi:hypothetical protein